MITYPFFFLIFDKIVFLGILLYIEKSVANRSIFSSARHLVSIEARNIFFDVANVNYQHYIFSLLLLGFFL